MFNKFKFPWKNASVSCAHAEYWSESFLFLEQAENLPWIFLSNHSLSATQNTLNNSNQSSMRNMCDMWILK